LWGVNVNSGMSLSGIVQQLPTRFLQLKEGLVMSSRTSAIVCCLLLVLATALPVQAATISNFESGTTDGWASVDENIDLVPDNTTASEGSWSLRIDRSVGDWSNTMVLDLIASGLWGDFTSEGTLLIDFKAQGGTDVPAWWWNMSPIFNSENGGWSQQPQVDPTLDGAWQTMVWEYSAQPPTPGSFGEFLLATNTGDMATVWIDNIRIVPEPSAIAVVLVGLVCLLVNRRLAAV
jgi:hypothetical protein